LLANGCQIAGPLQFRVKKNNPLILRREQRKELQTTTKLRSQNPKNGTSLDSAIGLHRDLRKNILPQIIEKEFRFETVPHYSYSIQENIDHRSSRSLWGSTVTR
jgi:hypothetical protein